MQKAFDFFSFFLDVRRPGAHLFNLQPQPSTFNLNLPTSSHLLPPPPTYQGLMDSPQAFYALILSPTRELAIQIAEQVEALGSGIGARAAPLVGGVDMTAQAIALSRRPHVLVGTPGRVVDHLSNTKGFSLKTLKHLVLDEADRLLNMDFEAEIDAVLKAIPREGRMTQLFSATMTSKVAKLQRACLRDPVRVETSSDGKDGNGKYQTVSTLRQQFSFVPAKHKDAAAVAALTSDELGGCTSIVFSRTCDGARRLALLLRALGLGALPIHGQMSQPKRLAALSKFKAGERPILVATDVASRGLDIPSVDLVLNYDVPMNSKDYVHRVGRTARAGRSGRALTLVTQYDVEQFQKIEALTGTKMEAWGGDPEAAELLAERVAEAGRLASAQMREADSKRGGGGGKDGGGKKRRGGAVDDHDDDNGGVGDILGGRRKFMKKY